MIAYLFKNLLAKVFTLAWINDITKFQFFNVEEIMFRLNKMTKKEREKRRRNETINVNCELITTIEFINSINGYLATSKNVNILHLCIILAITKKFIQKKNNYSMLSRFPVFIMWYLNRYLINWRNPKTRIFLINTTLHILIIYYIKNMPKSFHKIYLLRIFLSINCFYLGRNFKEWFLRWHLNHISNIIIMMIWELITLAHTGAKTN